MTPWDVAVIGAGAAGILAAMRAAERGRRTLLLEKNRRPGVKILISGGTRCNLTHATDRRGIVEAYGRQGPFLHSALAALDPQAVVALIEAEGVATKVEPGGKVFPVSDRALDILDALLARLHRSGCTAQCDQTVTALQRGDSGFEVVTPTQTVIAEKLIITTGGKSYPGCGTTGDGYAWAEQFGHTVVPPRPALTPITVHAPWVLNLQGVTVPDAHVRVVQPPDDQQSVKGKAVCLAERRSSLLFTHFGLSGPAALDVSRAVSGHARPESLVLECDFLPAVPAAQLELQLQSAATSAGKKQVATILPGELPRRLADALLALAGITPDQRAAELSKAQRQRLVQAIKQAQIGVAGTRGFKKAEVTAGGVRLEEVDSRTMQSKLIPNLFWAGEVLDLDGPIGGYNFQAAFSTGWLAGESV